MRLSSTAKLKGARFVTTTALQTNNNTDNDDDGIDDDNVFYCNCNQN